MHVRSPWLLRKQTNRGGPKCACSLQCHLPSVDRSLDPPENLFKLLHAMSEFRCCKMQLTLTATAHNSSLLPSPDATLMHKAGRNTHQIQAFRLIHGFPFGETNFGRGTLISLDLWALLSATAASFSRNGGFTTFTAVSFFTALLALTALLSSQYTTNSLNSITLQGGVQGDVPYWDELNEQSTQCRGAACTPNL